MGQAAQGGAFVITLPKGVEVFDLREEQLDGAKQEDPACQVSLAVVQVKAAGIVSVTIAPAVMNRLNDHSSSLQQLGSLAHYQASH